MARSTRADPLCPPTHGKPTGIPPKKPSMQGPWQNMCGKTRIAAEKVATDASLMKATSNPQKEDGIESSSDNPPHSDISSPTVSSPEEPASALISRTSIHGRPAIQPIGRYCIVIGRISSNKGLTSTKSPSGNKIQHDQAGNMKKKREEGLTLGERLGQNAPIAVRWEVLDSTFHKQQSCVDLEWRKEKKGQAAMVTDIKAFFHNIPKGSEVTVLVRCIDGLIVHRASFNQFVRFVVEDCRLNLLLIFQIYKFNAALYHPRMTPYRGLGSAMAFTGCELREYAKSGEDPTGELRLLYKCLKRMKNLKKWTNIGLQNRNTLPPANMYGARDLGGEVPKSESEDSE